MLNRGKIEVMKELIEESKKAGLDTTELEQDVRDVEKMFSEYEQQEQTKQNHHDDLNRFRSIMGLQPQERGEPDPLNKARRAMGLPVK